MASPPAGIAGNEGSATELECPRCGSAASPQQDYCLECGARLPPEAVAATAPGRLREGARESLLTVLVAFVVAVIAAAAVVAVQMTRNDTDQPLLVATSEQPDVQPEPEPQVETALPPWDEEIEGVQLEEEPAPAPPPQQQELISWPEGTDGFTVILASVPTSGGRPPATARARQARDAGLQEVGVLLSSDFSSLHPGYFVVFSGVYATRADAEAAVQGARAAGSQDAYVGQITP